MKVSIIVPVYNVEAYLCMCLNSLISQKFEDYEIICINDGSTDLSYNILKEYAKKFYNIKLIDNIQNKGLSYSRNRGIEEAQGEYILFVDSDDWLIDNQVLQQLYYEAKKEDLDLLRFRLNIDEIDYYPIVQAEGKEIFDELIQHDSFRWESVRNFVKKNLLIKNSIYFDERIYGCEDIWFSTQCILRAQKCRELKYKYYFYNRHNGSITLSTILNKNVKGYLMTIKLLYCLLCKESNEKLNYSLLSLIRKVSTMCQNTLWKLNENLSLDDWEEELCKLFDVLFSHGNLIDNSMIFKNWNRILTASDIYLYGAGMASCELWINLKNRIKFSGVIVTQNTEQCLTWNGLNIYNVSNQGLRKDALILVCVYGSAQDNIKKMLDKYNFRNVLYLGLH